VPTDGEGLLAVPSLESPLPASCLLSLGPPWKLSHAFDMFSPLRVAVVALAACVRVLFPVYGLAARDIELRSILARQSVPYTMLPQCQDACKTLTTNVCTLLRVVNIASTDLVPLILDMRPIQLPTPDIADPIQFTVSSASHLLSFSLPCVPLLITSHSPFIATDSLPRRLQKSRPPTVLSHH